MPKLYARFFFFNDECTVSRQIDGPNVLKNSLAPGDTLEDKYEIRCKIGEGGMGVVYEGRHRHLKMRVAIKVLLPFVGTDDNMRNRFKMEAQSSANIRHPNVVEVHDFGVTPDGRPFFVMEYLEGESLADLLDRRKILRQNRVVEILDQVLSGLSRAHKKHIIHRDLKPENIFLSKTEDNQEVVKILDFGIAKILEKRQSPRRTEPQHRSKRSASTTRFKTELGVVMGTPGYMAPEALTGQGVVDHRVDLFAVGVLLFEMLTGRQPFQGKTAHEIMVNTATLPVPRIRSINPHVTAEMEKLCLIALSKNQDDRFQDAAEFIEYLTAAAVGKTPSNARKCNTAVGIPSVIPATVKVLDEDDDEPSVADEFSLNDSLDLDLRDVENPGYFNTAASQIGLPPATDAGNGRPARMPQTTQQKPPQRWQPQTASKYVGPARKRRSEFSFSHIKFILELCTVGAAVYFISTSALFTTPMAEDPAFQVHNVLNAKEPPPDESLPDDVTIWVDVNPSDARILWNGELMTERPLRVPASKKPVKVEVTQKGYKRKILVVTPDGEKTISATLDAE